MRKTLGIVALAACLVVALGSAGGAGADGVKARTACGFLQLGSTYVYDLRAKGTSCDKARAVAKGFTKCRKQNGGANGKCHSRVKHFKCSEDRFDKNDFQYSSDVVCKRGTKRVRFTYTQNT
jgi:hypothetical protein